MIVFYLRLADAPESEQSILKIMAILIWVTVYFKYYFIRGIFEVT